MVRITFGNYGTVEHMFYEEGVSEKEALERFGWVWGVPVVPMNSEQPGGIRLISVGQAVDTKDTGGYGVGEQAA